MRLKQGQIAEHTRIVYQDAYKDGLQEGERRGWEKAIKAVAEWHDERGLEFVHSRAARDTHKYSAAAIRKLRKE